MITDTYLKQWEEARPRIEAGIEKHRKGDAVVRVLDRNGKPLAGQPVQVEQIASSFLFGANLFMIDAYQGEQARRYEQAYSRLFNAGTIALYWRDLEPLPGQLRFDKSSPFIRRRPPVDVSIEFARRNGLNINGHPLVWDFKRWSTPDWLANEPSIEGSVWERRIAQIAERYGDAVPRWDVVNEVLMSPGRLEKGLSHPMPPDYARLAFKWAEKYLPKSAHLMINEVSSLWARDREAYYQLIDRLINDGAKIDGIGLQLHLFRDEEIIKVGAGEMYTPSQMLEVLDCFAAFKRPLHISEITLTSPKSHPEGRQLQAAVARDFYRLWFSHPAVHAITWWNVPDGGAAPGEDSVDSGLLDANLNPKPAYEALDQLLNGEWRTRLALTTDSQGIARFRGFHGSYRLECDGAQATFDLPARADGTVVDTEVRLS